MISYEERSKKIGELERELSYSESEHKMLVKTYEEALNRGNYGSAETILNECIDKARHILELQQEISRLYNFNPGTTYVPNYGNNVTITNEEPKYTKGVSTAYNYANDVSTTYDENDYAVKCKEPKYVWVSNKLMDDVQNDIERCTRNNGFIVSFLDVPYDMIKSVEVFENQMALHLYDFVDSDGNPIIQKLHDVFMKDNFDITVQHVNNINELIYTEEYKNCCIVSISRSCLKYGSDDLSTISLEIMFREVEFKKPGIPKKKRTKNNTHEGSITQKD